ncbi:hypothetical protein HDK90DRAFT_274664 [Phyllosticta capitalensis]|uniref:Uncharacterized protein n=1 Tax=Phyllosticta capitalensis TaxID=121624 RepID=A0ABR1YMQ7_9PEZI
MHLLSQRTSRFALVIASRGTYADGLTRIVMPELQHISRNAAVLANNAEVRQDTTGNRNSKRVAGFCVFLANFSIPLKQAGKTTTTVSRIRTIFRRVVEISSRGMRLL